MKVRDVMRLIEDIETDQELLNEAIGKSLDGNVLINADLAQSLDDKLEDLKELHGMRELK